ncbi:MAG: cation:proton antiporter [Gammaproteobacteria bacterium]|nr:cation:proton antiporter [Gammaproteobacteria bacterium]
MQSDPVVFTIFLIFTGAAILATLALYARQAMIVAYILLGIVIGPFGVGLVEDSEVTQEIAHIGIMFLLFLLGLNLYPQKLLALVKETTLITGLSSLLFALIGAATGWLLGFSWSENLIIGGTLMFSSTIIGLKLLPLTVLHHKRTGEVIISILLLQDLIAIVILLILETTGRAQFATLELLLLLLSLPGLILFALLFSRYVLVTLISRFDKIQEYIFLLAIGWCLGMAELAAAVGLSHEIGAFIAGVALATSPISDFIADSLRPLRDFFLVIFFFSLGASLNLEILMDVLIPALVIAATVLILKPIVFKVLLQKSGESAQRSREIGFRLGQISEFSLLIAMLALDHGIIGHRASYLIQLSTVLTFIASSYIIVLRFPTPIAVTDDLRRD